MPPCFLAKMVLLPGRFVWLWERFSNLEDSTALTVKSMNKLRKNSKNLFLSIFLSWLELFLENHTELSWWRSQRGPFPSLILPLFTFSAAFPQSWQQKLGLCLPCGRDIHNGKCCRWGWEVQCWMSHVLCQCTAVSVHRMTWSLSQRRARLGRVLWTSLGCSFSVHLSEDGCDELSRGSSIRRSAEAVLQQARHRRHRRHRYLCRSHRQVLKWPSYREHLHSLFRLSRSVCCQHRLWRDLCGRK